MKFFSVTELAENVKSYVEQNPEYQFIGVRGEVSNYFYRPQGLSFLTLKDEKTRLSAVIFTSTVQRLPFELRDGLQVEAYGQLIVYPADGKIQLKIIRLTTFGAGNLRQHFLLLRDRLRAEGVFDLNTIPVPPFPERIAIISAPQGSALQDVQITLKNRWPVAEAVLFPCQVQGETAARTVIQAYHQAIKIAPDVIIICRGGGSEEDLYSFNDEELALTIANSKFCVISGIGHEDDFTILDYVASLRAPTPTAAAVLATPEMMTVYQNLLHLDQKVATWGKRLVEELTSRFQGKAAALEKWVYNFLIEANRLKEYRYQIDQAIARSLTDKTEQLMLTQRRVSNSLQDSYDSARLRISQYQLRLESQNIEKIFEQGYGLVYDSKGHLLDFDQVQKGEKIAVYLKQGIIKAVVAAKEEQDV